MEREQSPVWLVFGTRNGRDGIYSNDLCPRLRCGRASPPLPIAIQCLSRSEAEGLYRVVRSILSRLSNTPPTSELLAVFGASPQLLNFFGDNGEFFAVVVGSPPGIHRSLNSAVRSQGRFTHPHWRHKSSFWEALAFVIVKGIDRLMPQNTTSAEQTPTDDSGMQALTANLEDNLRLHSSSPVPAADEPLPTFGDVPLVPPLDVRGLHFASSIGPFIYTHVRTLRGIIESRYYSTPPLTTQVQLNRLSSQAARYLAAHGYTRAAVDTIINVWLDNESESERALHLTGLGMAYEEAKYLCRLLES